MQLNVIDLVCPGTGWDWQGDDPTEAEAELVAHVANCPRPVAMSVELIEASPADVARLFAAIGGQNE
jgi:hypothetical protein